MAIYRPPKPRWPLATGTALIGLAVGLIFGGLLFRSDPDATESVSLIKTKMLSAAGSLEVAAVEYAESVEDGEVLSEPEYEGALGAVRSSRAAFDEVRPGLEGLAPERTTPIVDLYDEIETLMEAQAPDAEVEEALGRLEALLKGE